MKVAFIGLKGHQGVALGQIKEAGCTLAGVCDDHDASLAAVAKWPAATPETRVFTDFRLLLDTAKPDIVVEAGTDNQRAAIIAACAERGIHVLAEKPLAFTIEELDELQNAVKAHGIHLSMLLTMRFEGAYRLVREQVAAGAVGTVCQASMQKSYRLGNRPEWQRSKDTFSGIIPFIGIHALDLIRWTSGREFNAAMAFQGNTGHPELGDMEDNACVALKLDNGGSAAVRLDYCRPAAAPTHGDDRLRIAGTDGVIESLDCGSRVNLITATGKPRELALPPAGRQFVNFVRSIENREACAVPAADCFRMTEVVLKIRDAARQGAAVSLA
jgi:predicted dehydrogenase